MSVTSRRSSALRPRTPASRRSCGCRARAFPRQLARRGRPGHRRARCRHAEVALRMVSGCRSPRWPSLGDRGRGQLDFERHPMAEWTRRSTMRRLILMIESPQAVDNSIRSRHCKTSTSSWSAPPNQLFVEVSIPARWSMPWVIDAFRQIVTLWGANSASTPASAATSSRACSSASWRRHRLPDGAGRRRPAVPLSMPPRTAPQTVHTMPLG